MGLSLWLTFLGCLREDMEDFWEESLMELEVASLPYASGSRVSVHRETQRSPLRDLSGYPGGRGVLPELPEKTAKVFGLVS